MSSDLKACKNCSKPIKKGLAAYCSYSCSEQAARKRKKERKAVSTGALMAKADRAASSYYRARTPYCEAAGKDSINCGGGLQWAHIMSRGNKRLRYEEKNHLVMCAGHHVYYTHHPYEWSLFIEENFNDRHEFVKAHRNEYIGDIKQHFLDAIETFKKPPDS